MPVSGAWFDNGAISLERTRKNQLMCSGLFAFVVSQRYRRQVETRVWSSRKAELHQRVLLNLWMSFHDTWWHGRKAWETWAFPVLKNGQQKPCCRYHHNHMAHEECALPDLPETYFYLEACFWHSVVISPVLLFYCFIRVCSVVPQHLPYIQRFGLSRFQM